MRNHNSQRVYLLVQQVRWHLAHLQTLLLQRIPSLRLALSLPLLQKAPVAPALPTSQLDRPVLQLHDLQTVLCHQVVLDLQAVLRFPTTRLAQWTQAGQSVLLDQSVLESLELRRYLQGRVDLQGLADRQYLATLMIRPGLGSLLLLDFLCHLVLPGVHLVQVVLGKTIRMNAVIL